MVGVVNDCFLLILKALAVAQRKDEPEPSRHHIFHQRLLLEGCKHEVILELDH